MRPKFTPLTPELYGYLVQHGQNHDPLLAELAAETEQLGGVSVMQVAPEQGTLLSLLARAINARSAIEIGTFTGYSAICIARGLAADGRLLCCDVSDEWTTIARRYFAKARLTDRIDLRLAPALDTLACLAPDVTFDFAFIDADKSSYRAYYEALLRRLRPNGLIIFDNVLWSGHVLDASDTTEDTCAMRELNLILAQDRRVHTVMIAVADGLTIVRKRADDETPS
jgi:caffeoyl-CoA O-methyltransferase